MATVFKVFLDQVGAETSFAGCDGRRVWLRSPWWPSETFIPTAIRPIEVNRQGSATSAVVGGAAGMALLGPIGFAGGALLGGQARNEVTFEVETSAGQTLICVSKTSVYPSLRARIERAIALGQGAPVKSFPWLKTVSFMAGGLFGGLIGGPIGIAIGLAAVWGVLWIISAKARKAEPRASSEPDLGGA